jgi:hypothetical protein
MTSLSDPKLRGRPCYLARILFRNLLVRYRKIQQKMRNVDAGRNTIIAKRRLGMLLPFAGRAQSACLSR